MTSTIPLIPDHAPFSPEQRAWLNGFFAGIFSRAAAAPGPAAPGPTLVPLTILFGSQTGTAELLARRAAKEAGKRGFAASVLDMAETDAIRLAGETQVLVIVSTYGEGEPPDSAKALHAALAAPNCGRLGRMRFAVCALGDTQYPQFCQCGKDFDARLEKLGAIRVTARVDCDLDYEGPFGQWLDAALAALSAGGRPALAEAPRPAVVAPPPPAAPAGFSKSRPFPALLLASRNLNGAGSGKRVHHVEFSLEGSGLDYEAGDALGVLPQNCPEQVEAVLEALGCDGEEAVPTPDGSTRSLRLALTDLYDLGKPSPDLLERCPAGGHHVIDVILAHPGLKLAPADFVRCLKKLQPRLYSISSSPKAHPGQVHLTVGAVRYDRDGRPRKGVCSTFLAERAQPGATRVGVFVHANRSFRPPSAGDAPMIMVGPGTGIAPFRAFLQERRLAGATGRSWLFFGDQCAATDFLYRDELAQMQSEGALTRLDTAFSRDQADKIYVQHRMLENARELYGWLEAGAYFYVCGEAGRMAKDVDAALHAVIERVGAKTPEQAAEYVQGLRAAKRYLRDVY